LECKDLLAKLYSHTLRGRLLGRESGPLPPKRARTHGFKGGGIPGSPCERWTHREASRLSNPCLDREHISAAWIVFNLQVQRRYGVSVFFLLSHIIFHAPIRDRLSPIPHRHIYRELKPLHQVIWSTRDDATSTYVYNTASWLYGVTGLTASSPWNSTYNFQSSATLITRRHAVVADHFHPLANSTVRFVGGDNVTYTRTVLGYSKINASYDCGLIVLNNDFPATVSSVKIFPVEGRNKLSPNQEYWPSDHGARYWVDTVKA
jgi:hypothetical protein